MPVENIHQVANLRADLIAVYQPVNSQELFAIERIALAQLSLLRSYRFEAGLEFPANPHNSSEWTILLRYQAQAERLYRRALEEFDRLQALRGRLPEQDMGEPEPVARTQPEEPETAAPAADHRRLPRHQFKRRRRDQPQPALTYQPPPFPHEPPPLPSRDREGANNINQPPLISNQPELLPPGSGQPKAFVLNGRYAHCVGTGRTTRISHREHRESESLRFGNHRAGTAAS